MIERPKVLVIAGSDSSGLAGLQRDNQSILVLGGHPLNIVSAVTAQNADGVKSINASSTEAFENQLSALQSSGFTAVKIGLLCSTSQVLAVVKFIQSLPQHVPVVVDPVLCASSGERFSDKTMLAAIKEELLPLCELITPNLLEASELCGFAVDSFETMESAAASLRDSGAKNVLIKGGHHFSDSYSSDYFSGEKTFWLSSKRISTEDNRGTGCALASSVACARVLGFSIEDAVVIGKMAINEGLRNAYSIEGQAGPVNCTVFPDSHWNLPKISFSRPKDFLYPHFPDTNLPDGRSAPLGIYPVVDSVAWIERLLPCGVTTIQLRIKNLEGAALENEIERAVALAKQHNCRLFINDYWQLAIKFGAYGVHLGQEDLQDANIEEIHKAGLCLGISTHCYYEIAHAHTFKPSYIACGPVFHTDTKDMPWVPQGVKGFKYWHSLMSNYPLVAIGGIKEQHIPELAAVHANGIAMITGITRAADPEGTAIQFMGLFNQYYLGP